MLREVDRTRTRRNGRKPLLADIVRTLERRVSPVGCETIPCRKALGRIAARTVKAGRNLPLFDVSALDGFACKGPGTRFVVKGSSGPGEKSLLRLQAGEALFVPTGAAIPPHTRFVPVEQVREEAGHILVKASGDMRKTWKKGYWIKKADEVVKRGERVKPRTMELLALAGLTDIALFLKPKVCILSTGNELKTGLLPNSNQSLLAALVERDGGEIAQLATAGDDDEEIGESIAAMAGADLLLVTGGTAMGKRDVTRSSFEKRRATFLLDGLPIVPGKTMTAGKLAETLFFILPGNPRALRTLYEAFIKRCLWKLAGRSGGPQSGTVPVPDDLEKEKDRIHLIPVTLARSPAARITELYADEPDAFIILERGITRVRKGREVELQWLDP